MKCPRCQHENRAAANYCEECGFAVNRATSTVRTYAGLKDDVDGATAEILRVISESPNNTQPIFDALTLVRERAGRRGLEPPRLMK